MGLKLYDLNQVAISTSATFTNPLQVAHDGKNGSVSVSLAYIRNDDSNKWYQSVRINPRDITGYDDTIGEYGTGFGVKLKYGGDEPLPHEWNSISSGNTITLPGDVGTSSIADTTTYFPVWVRIKVPGNTQVQLKQDITLRLRAVERIVI